MRRRTLASILGLLAVSATLSACGSKGVDVPDDDAAIRAGAVLFAERCSGCHTLSVDGTQGSATKVHDREHTDGPNFDTRNETVDEVLYAIRNGGFSGAIMPENIVVGRDAENVAKFLAKYAGKNSD